MVMTFREYNDIQLEYKYIEAVYDPVTQLNLTQYCNKHGLDISKNHKGEFTDTFSFHTTIIDTISKHILVNGSYRFCTYAKPIGFDLFGEEQNYLVLLIESPGIREQRKIYELSYEMKDKYELYRPHITLTYNHQGAIPNIDEINFPLVTDVVNVKKDIE